MEDAQAVCEVEILALALLDYENYRETICNCISNKYLWLAIDLGATQHHCTKTPSFADRMFFSDWFNQKELV